MTVLFLVLYFAISLFIIVMWVRLVFDLISNVNRGWRPSGPALVIAELAYTATDPPIKLVRRAVPPLRVGEMSLDLSWTIVMIVAFILSFAVTRFL